MLGLSGGLRRATRLQSLTRCAATKLSQSMAVPSNANRSFSVSSLLAADSPYARQGVGTIDEAIARSQSGSQCACDKSAGIATNADASEVQMIVGGLPEIPRPPGKKRTFHIAHDDLEGHMRPLLACHWHVGHVGEVDVGWDGGKASDALEVLCLNKLFSFKNFRVAVEFFDALADVQEDERHHARVIVDYANVYVSVHTHVAYESRSISDSREDVQPVKVPGLTARDVRFAVQVEKLHETFLNNGHAVTSIPFDSASLQAWSMEQLRRRYPAPRE